MSVRAGVPLAGLTTLGVGGPADVLVTAGDEAEVLAAVREADAAGAPLLVLGGGSNVVVADEGFPGTVVRVASRGVVEEPSPDGGVRLVVQAGEPWDELVTRAVQRGLAGLECLAGIPGSVGATPVQNVGAYGQEVAESISSLRVLDRHDDAARELTPAECGFRYRGSVLKDDDRFVVLAVSFDLVASPQSGPVRYAELARRLGVEVGGRAPLDDVRAAVLELRRIKGMVLDAEDPDTRSAGSFFTNPVLSRRQADALPTGAPRFPQADGRVKVPAAWLIEAAGVGRGHGNGAARVSSKHTLALTNTGGATTAELLALAREVRDAVLGRFGVELEVEPVLVGCRLEAATR